VKIVHYQRFGYRIDFLTRFCTATMVRQLSGVFPALGAGFHGQQMTGSDPLKDFEQRLDKTLDKRRGQSGADTSEYSAAGLAMRAVLELLIGLAVCMALGWAADKYFGTAPWIMLALMPLGLAAGVVNVMRLSKSKAAEDVLGARGPVAPSVKDDDED
jgi:ATP synthase protein I